ncbi:peptidase M48 [Chromatiales bacterium (ex Bugula neritina AB1)]|nr:peptidase M48 [Chromatiales bacterium (ex Bugula neritina AB1)]
MRIRHLAVLVAAVWISGCATNPVTGKKELSIVSEKQELEIGQQQYSPSRQSQGGDYVADPHVQAYVNKVGQRLAAVSDRKLPYEFHVLNSDVPNAWALPGGKIAINRGLLIEMQSEAELAAVLGHEIVHAAAKHGARSITRGTLLQGGLVATAIATAGTDYSDIAQMGANVGAQLINTRYGRDAERESDRYGIEYMARAGYDPQGAVDLQQTFLNLSGSKKQDFISGLFASHPPSAERLANNRKIAASMEPGGEIGRERYEQNIAHLRKVQPAYDAYKEAKKAAKDKNYSRARALARKAISIEPREGHFHSFLGDLEFTDGNFPTAGRHYRDAISRNDQFYYYHLQYGLVSEKTRDFAEAETALARSVELLPTANAHNALGNIARATGSMEQAVAQYAKAAKHNSPAGKEALGSLVDIDLPANPGKYIATRPKIQKNGALQVVMQNKTPRNLGKITLKVIYPGNNGRMREFSRQLSGVLDAGKSDVLDLPLRINPDFARNVRVEIVRASVMR